MIFEGFEMCEMQKALCGILLPALKKGTPFGAPFFGAGNGNRTRSISLGS